MTNPMSKRVHTYPTRSDGMVNCPFHIVIDTKEKIPYTFVGLTTNEDTGSKLIYVPLIYEGLPWGDYTINGLTNIIAIERKSKADFLGSVARRENFIERLDAFTNYKFSSVIVEAEWSEIFTDRGYSQIGLKSLYRTWLAWTIRYPMTRWYFLPGRRVAEKTTFRLLERFWLDRVKRGEELSTVPEMSKITPSSLALGSVGEGGVGGGEST